MEIDAILRECETLRKAEKYGAAVELLNAALSETTDACLFYSRAMTFDLMDQEERAVDDLTSAIALDKTIPQYFFDRACMLAFPLDRHDEAIRDFEQVLKLQPDHTEAHRECCGSLLIMGRPNRALEHARAALKLAPKEARTHYFLGEAYISLGRFREAVTSLRKAVELDSTKDQYRSALSRAVDKLNNSTESGRGAANRRA